MAPETTKPYLTTRRRGPLCWNWLSCKCKYACTVECRQLSSFRYLNKWIFSL